jgi:hypothetical protein
LLLALTACGSGDVSGGEEPRAQVSRAATPVQVPVLPDGPLAAGRYRYVLGDWDTCDPHLGCTTKVARSAVPDIEVTAPEGWEAANEFHLIAPSTRSGPEGPDGAALVLGWTSYWVGLNAEPCLPIGIPGGHQVPDIRVGPTAADFADAVAARPALHATRPREVTLGGYPGRFFSLTAPRDISGCDNWRPWDPGFFAQGPDSTWEVWAVDVNGLRVVVVATHFPGTPEPVRAHLPDMVTSHRLVTRASTTWPDTCAEPRRVGSSRRARPPRPGPAAHLGGRVRA